MAPRWEAFTDLKAHALAEMAADGLDPGALRVRGEVERRYLGQTYTLEVPLLEPGFLEEFHTRHRRLYGHHFSDRPVEAVVLRLSCLAPEPPALLPPLTPVFPAAAPVLPHRTTLWLPEGPVAAPVYYRPTPSPRTSAAPDLPWWRRISPPPWCFPAFGLGWRRLDTSSWRIWQAEQKIESPQTELYKEILLRISTN